MRYFIRLAYDGSDFNGWQLQDNAPSVQDSLQEALKIILQKEVSLTGCGRTDAGVHAREFYAHFDHPEPLQDTDQFVKKLNDITRHDIAILDLLPVKPDAHARFDAIKRSYAYYVLRRKNPFKRNHALLYQGYLDVILMNTGADILRNNRDFTSFTKLHSQTKTNMCQVFSAVWEETEDELIFKISADRFLRNMVRAIVGTLLDLGRGKINLNDLQQIIDKKNRSAAGTSVQAKGLFLTKIEYPPDLFLNNSPE